MSAADPIVTIGLPVYNEAPYVAESIDRLLAQTYPHIRIIIGDNGSTDDTTEICRRYAEAHPHITHLRHDTNIGQHANFNSLAKAATGTYFCWVGGHDLLDNDFVEQCVAVLEASPQTVLAYPRTMYTAQDGTPRHEKPRPFDIRTLSPERRFAEVMWRVDCNYVYGMYRLEPMQASRLFQIMPALDRVFLAEMAVKGVFTPVNTFRYSRDTRNNDVSDLENRRRTMAYLHPGRTVTDAELLGGGYYRPTRSAFFRIVREARFPLFSRLRAYASVWLCGVMKYHIFPGADTLSAIVKALLPRAVLQRVLHMMQ